MLKQTLKSIIQKAVNHYKARQQKQRDDQLFAKCMIASGSIREVREPKIVKGYIDSVNWGGMK